MPKPRWVAELAAEDLLFIRRFVLASGSLKAVAAEYGVSYPTIRLRLDRLIERLRRIEELADCPPFERRLRLLLAEGRLAREDFDDLLAAWREEHPC